MLRRRAVCAAALPVFLLVATPADAQGVPHGASIVRALGSHAETTLAPASGRIGALVRIPNGTTAASLGVVELAPGVGRLRASADGILSFASAHPDVAMEVSPPLHMLLDQAGIAINAISARRATGLDGSGVLVGVADVGVDVTHPDLLDANGKSRIAWILDLSLPPQGLHPELEAKYGIKDAAGNLAFGAVYTGDDIDMIRNDSSMKHPLPQDEVGHGTHVSSIACGNGGTPPGPFVGIAPNAKLVFARVAEAGAADSIQDDDALAGVSFIFDRADFMQLPVSVNFSLGKDFGPHDGSTLWEQSLASFVGPDKPGHAFVVAAGNSGDIVSAPIHDSVYVSEGSRTRVPITTNGAQAGGIQVWVAMREGSDLSVGLESPSGEWIAPVAQGSEQGHNEDLVNAGVINGDTVSQSPIPQGSHGAVVVWSGAWPGGTYDITLEGHGTADLFLQADGDALFAPGNAIVGFAGPVREGTVDLPATHPSIIAVGCTVSKPNWVSIDHGKVLFVVPVLDSYGGLPDPGRNVRPLGDGEICYFSGAGPTLTGVAKPEIAAPGAVITAAMSKQATPGSDGSIFTNPDCPPAMKGGDADPKCMQVDPTHAVNAGTSMSSPMVAGAIALLFQRDPTLTQDRIAMLLQAGAHDFRSASATFEDQGGPGELDVAGSLAALSELTNPTPVLPDASHSWLTLSADYYAADGSTPLLAIVELRGDDALPHGDVFDKSRLQLTLAVNGESRAAPTLTRRGPGVWYATIAIESGLGGGSLRVGATFDGAPIVAPKTVPIATDIWSAGYPTTVKGGCEISTAHTKRHFAWAAFACAPFIARAWRRRRRVASRV